MGHPEGHNTPRTQHAGVRAPGPCPWKTRGRARLAPKPHPNPGLGPTGRACRSVCCGFGAQLGSVPFCLRFSSLLSSLFRDRAGARSGPVGVPEQRRIHLVRNYLLNCSRITHQRLMYSLPTSSFRKEAVLVTVLAVVLSVRCALTREV